MFKFGDFLLVSVIYCSLTSSPSIACQIAHASTEDAVLQEMEAARKQWLQKVELKCTFSYSEGCAKSIESGWKGLYDPTRTRVIRANGKLVKKQDAIRLEVVSDVPAAFNPETRTAGWCSFDTAVANDVNTFMLPIQRGHLSKEDKLGGTVAFQDHTKTNKQFDNVTDNVYQPFLLCAGNGIAHFEWLNDDLKWTVNVHKGEKYTSICFDRLYPNGSTCSEKKEYKFWTGPEIPVLTEFDHVSYAEGSLHYRFRVKASNFVDCGEGLMFPRSVKGAWGIKGNDGVMYRTSSWATENAGNEHPKKSDFEYILTDQMSHVGAGPKLRKLKKFNVLDVELSDTVYSLD